MKKRLSFILSLFFCFTVFAQSADVITDILEAETATVGQICYLTAVQMNLAEESVSYEAATNIMLENNYLFSDKKYDEPVTAREIAFIYSKCWPIKGGLFYRITKGAPRYAFKQFVSDGIIDSSTDPSDFVSGAKALSFYTSCINAYDSFNLASVSMESE